MANACTTFVVTLNNVSGLPENYYDIFNDAFYSRADARILNGTLTINPLRDTVSFTLEEQTEDVPFGNFTKEQIMACLENIKQSNIGLDFESSIEEREGLPISGCPKNKKRTRGGKKSRRKSRRTNKRTKHSNTKQRRK